MDCTAIGAAATDREITEGEIADFCQVLDRVRDGRCRRRRLSNRVIKWVLSALS